MMRFWIDAALIGLAFWEGWLGYEPRHSRAADVLAFKPGRRA